MVRRRADLESSLLAVPTPLLQALGQSDTETFRRLSDLANIGVDLAVRISAELLIPQSARRVAAILVRVAAPDAIDGRVEADDVLIGQAQLAEMSNVSRNLANVALAQFRRAGWAETYYGRVRIIDAAALAGFAYAED